jgi:hypothetical protein
MFDISQNQKTLTSGEQILFETKQINSLKMLRSESEYGSDKYKLVQILINEGEKQLKSLAVATAPILPASNHGANHTRPAPGYPYPDHWEPSE